MRSEISGLNLVGPVNPTANRNSLIELETFDLLLNPSARISVVDVRGYQCMVVDDAFVDPGSLREHAKTSMIPSQIRDIPIGYEIHPKDFDTRFPDFKTRIAELIQENIGDNVRESFGLDSGNVELRPFRGPYYNCVGVWELPIYAPHVDHGHISSFAYLNLPQQCAGGTRIYRHIPMDTMCIVQSDTTRLEKVERTKLSEPLVEGNDEWEMVHFFKMKYNRLIAFNSSIIHKIDITGGRFTMDINTTRLCINCFYEFYNTDGSAASREPV